MGLIQRGTAASVAPKLQPQQQLQPTPVAPVAQQPPLAKPPVAPPVPQSLAKPSPAQQQAVNAAGFARAAQAQGFTPPVPQPVAPYAVQGVYQEPAVTNNSYAAVENPLAAFATTEGGGDEFGETFPLNAFSPAGIIAYQIADAVGHYNQSNNDPAPYTRYLFSDGVHRKWTAWVKLSTAKQSNLVKMFLQVPNPQTYTEDVNIFNTCFNILVQQKLGTKYVDITQVALGTEDVSQLFYDIEYTPLKLVNVYGQKVPLRLAVLKTEQGIVRLQDGEFKDNAQYEAERAAFEVDGGGAAFAVSIGDVNYPQV